MKNGWERIQWCLTAHSTKNSLFLIVISLMWFCAGGEKLNPGTTFDSTKQSLQDFLKEIKAGKIQLPDFQRGWIWDDNHVKSLLASISVS
jgi:hypothetical protein